MFVTHLDLRKNGQRTAYSCAYCFDPIVLTQIIAQQTMSDGLSISLCFCGSEHLTAYFMGEAPV